MTAKTSIREARFQPYAHRIDAIVSIGFGDPIPEVKLRDAKRVTLKLRSESIDVVSEHYDDGTIAGEIDGFSSSISEEYSGIRIGERIVFEARHVFGLEMP